MPTPIKPHECVRCGETRGYFFYGKNKTLCKQCTKFRNELPKESLLRKFECIFCSVTEEDKFYSCNKSKCKKCLSTERKQNRAEAKEVIKLKPKIVIVPKVLEEDEIKEILEGLYIELVDLVQACSKRKLTLHKISHLESGGNLEGYHNICSGIEPASPVKRRNN